MDHIGALNLQGMVRYGKTTNFGLFPIVRTFNFDKRRMLNTPATVTGGHHYDRKTWRSIQRSYARAKAGRWDGACDPAEQAAIVRHHVGAADIREAEARATRVLVVDEHQDRLAKRRAADKAKRAKLKAEKR